MTSLLENLGDEVYDIYTMISKKIGRELIPLDYKMILKHLMKFDSSVLKDPNTGNNNLIVASKNVDRDIALEKISSVIANAIEYKRDIIMSEFDRPLEVQVSSVFGLSKETLVDSLSEQKYKKAYLTLTSDNRSLEIGDFTKMKWNYTGTIKYDRRGNIYSSFPIRDIKAMRLGPFNAYLQRTTGFFGTLPRTSPLYTILIEEFQHQAFLGSKKFHFEMHAQKSARLGELYDYKIDDRVYRYEAQPMYKDFFVFDKPITVLDSITISMTDGLGNDIDIPMAKHFISSMTLTAGLRPRITVTTNTYHFKTGQRVVVTGFNTTSPLGAVDQPFITQINRAEGFEITMDGPYYNFYLEDITVPVGLSAKTGNAYIIDEEAAVCFNLELLCLEDS